MDWRTAIIGSGSTIILVAGSEDTGGLLSLLDYELAPGFASLPPHTHSYEDEATCVLEGLLLVRLGGCERLLGPGEFILLPRGIAHAQRNPGSLPCRFLMLLIPAGFEQCFHDLDVLLEGGAVCSMEVLAPLLARYGTRPLGEAEPERHARS